MFEDYIEDAYFFATAAGRQSTEREQQRFYRASVFYAASALEAFVNYIADTFAAGDVLEPFDRAFLLDRKFGLRGGEFTILETTEFHRIDDKLRLLLHKFCPSFDLSKEASWSQFNELKDLRDSIVHPRHEEDDVTAADYRTRLSTGLGAVLKLIDCLCQGIFKRPLRQRLLDLTL